MNRNLLLPVWVFWAFFLFSACQARPTFKEVHPQKVKIPGREGFPTRVETWDAFENEDPYFMRRHLWRLYREWGKLPQKIKSKKWLLVNCDSSGYWWSFNGDNAHMVVDISNGKIVYEDADKVAGESAEYIIQISPWRNYIWRGWGSEGETSPSLYSYVDILTGEVDEFMRGEKGGVAKVLRTGEMRFCCGGRFKVVDGKAYDSKRRLRLTFAPGDWPAESVWMDRADCVLGRSEKNSGRPEMVLIPVSDPSKWLTLGKLRPGVPFGDREAVIVGSCEEDRVNFLNRKSGKAKSFGFSKWNKDYLLEFDGNGSVAAYLSLDTMTRHEFKDEAERKAKLKEIGTEPEGKWHVYYDRSNQGFWMAGNLFGLTVDPKWHSLFVFVDRNLQVAGIRGANSVCPEGAVFDFETTSLIGLVNQNEYLKFPLN